MSGLLLPEHGRFEGRLQERGRSGVAGGLPGSSPSHPHPFGRLLTSKSPFPHPQVILISCDIPEHLS